MGRIFRQEVLSYFVDMLLGWVAVYTLFTLGITIEIDTIE
jgi:hypothetical protein